MVTFGNELTPVYEPSSEPKLPHERVMFKGYVFSRRSNRIRFSHWHGLSTKPPSQLRRASHAEEVMGKVTGQSHRR